MIEVQTEGARTTLTLDRPDKANALTAEMLSGMCDAVQDATQSGQKALILTGRGKVFSAGADLDAARAGLATSPLWETLSAALAAFPGLSVAALNGTVAGGAMGMVLACDLRIAVPQSKFFYPVMSLGFLPQPSDPARLAALVGPARAKMILMAGQKIPAETALNWGLLDRVCDGAELAAQAQGLTEIPMQAAAEHVAAIKHMIPTQ